MKTTCNFCKTEYNLDKFPNTPVKCAVCGHVWTPRRSLRRNSILKFIAALCAFAAACIFSFVVIVGYQNDKSKKQPLVANIDEQSVHLVVDENGSNRVFVSGNITNNTDNLYGLPNIIIVSHDVSGNILSRQTFIPPVTLLAPRTTVTFNYMLSVDPTNVKRVTVELKETK